MYQFSTQPLKQGYYDLALVIVVNPTNTADDSLTRVRSTFTPVLRRSVYVGDAKPPEMNVQPFPMTADSGEFSDLVFLTEQQDSLNQMPGRHVAPNEKLNLFVRTIPVEGTNPDQAIPVALVAFMDNRVVPLSDLPVVYGLTEQGEISTLPITIAAPEHVGKHQYFVHQFPNPYVETTSTSQSDLSFYSLSTQRIVLDVKQP